MSALRIEVSDWRKREQPAGAPDALPNHYTQTNNGESMEDVRFCGTALADLRAFPPDMKRAAGVQIDRVQRGLMPTDWKTVPTIGPGVVEIRLRSTAGAFRVIYVASVGNDVVVLHCFQKKTQQLSRRDVELAASRYQSLLREKR